MATLDFSKIPNYSNRQMFLDPAGSVTIQRYEEYAFPKVAEFLNIQKGAFWQPGEINLMKDQIDFKEASRATSHIYTSNLLRQTTLDSIQGRSPVQIFTPVCSVPEIEGLMLWWSAIEQIHSDSYSHIIKNIYNVPVEQFNSIHDNPEIINMTSGISKYYDELHQINSNIITLNSLREDVKRNPELKALLAPTIKYLESQTTEHKHIRAIWMALIASYGLEAIRFMVSFATSLGMVENKIFIGSGNIISLILQDETLHTKWTAWIINSLVKRDPRFKQVALEMMKEARDALITVIDEEKSWAKYQFKFGPMSGMNEKIMVDFVDHTAPLKLNDIGIKIPITVRSTPLPWYNKHFNTNKKQVAMQETENVAYVLGAMTSTIDYDDLPDL
jgi:ribonucleoside-diphosphate reductase beta chain